MRILQNLRLIISTLFLFVLFTNGQALVDVETPLQTDFQKPLGYFILKDSREINSIKAGPHNYLIEKAFSLQFSAKIMASTSEGKGLYVFNKEAQELIFVDCNTGIQIRINSPKGVPASFAVASNNKIAYASYENQNKIFKFDLVNNSYSTAVQLDRIPEKLVLDASDEHLYLLMKGQHQLFCAETATFSIKPILDLNGSAEGLVLSSDGEKLYLIQEEGSRLTSVDIPAQTYSTAQCRGLNSFYIEQGALLGINSRKGELYLASPFELNILLLDLKEHQFETALEFDQPIESIHFCSESILLASFSANQDSEGLPVQFDASKTSSLKEGKIDYYWDFGDGLGGYTEEPYVEHLYEQSGDYVAGLTVAQALDSVQISTHQEVIHIIGFDAKDFIRAKSISTTSDIASSANPSSFQQSVTFTATLTVLSGSGTPTGSYTFFDGATSLGTVNLSGLTAALTLSNLSVGTHTITATYSGDSNYSSSTTPNLNQVVNQTSTTTNLTSSPSSSEYQQAVLLTATVTPSISGTIIPTGTVSFYDGSTLLGTSNVSGTTATLSTSSLTVGSHSLTAVYNGDINYTTSTSNTVSQVVSKANSTTALTSSVNPTIFGNATLLTATVTVTAGTPTGTVTFRNGTTTIGTGTLSGGVATLSVSNLSVGTDSLTAIYGGDGNFNTSTSNTVSQVVNQGTTQSTLTSSVPTTTYGQSTTLTATVAVVTGSGTPTGYFTFMDGSTVLGTVNLTGLSASWAIANLSVGTHSLTAIYSGDTNFQTSTSSPATIQTVNKATPVIALTDSPTSSNYGDMVTFTSTVTAPTTLGLPSGTVSFYDGATLLGTSTLSGTSTNTSTATFILNTLTGGTHSITAVYSGDVDFVTVTSSPAISYVVSPLSTTTTLYANSTDATEYGQPLILYAKVTGSTAAPPLPPSGTVTFYDGSTVIGTTSLSAISANTSLATLTYSGLSLGSHNLQATYSADTNYNASTSNVLAHTVVTSNTISVVTSSVNPGVVGQSITFTSTVSPTAPGMGNPTGTVDFYNGTVLLGTGTLSPSGADASVATFTTSSLTLGNHTIFASYLSDGNFTSSTSSSITQVIQMDSTTTVMTSSEPTSNFGDLVTWTATVTANAPGSGTPTGTVTFYNGSTLMGTGTLNGSGVATYSSNKLYPGTYSLKAVYGGDSNYITSTSAIFTQTVINQLPTVTTVTSSRNSSPINNAVTYSALVTAITGIPTGTVSFYDNGVLLGTGMINAQGVAVVTEPGSNMTTAPTTHPITAIYSGDANFVTSTSPIFDQYVVPYNTTTVLTSTPNHSEQANATFTATVTPTGTPTPIPQLDGTVTFYDGTTAISGAIPVPASGIVTFQPNNLHFNARFITAVYSGDQTQFATSTSNTIDQQVQQTDMLTTTTTVTTSQAMTYNCQPVTFTANVVQTQGFYIPTGTVTFFDGSNSIGTSILDEFGDATLTTTSLSIGVHEISATYNSDSNYAFSASAQIMQTVQADTTTTSLSVIPNIATTPYGQNLLFVAQVTAAYGTAVGQVTFSYELGDLATVDLDSTGVASYSSDSMGGGTHTVTATYSGSCCPSMTSCFSGSSTSITHTISLINPELSLAATPSPATYGNVIMLVADISSYATGTPTGSVTFAQGNTVIGTTPISDGLATIDVFNIPAGLTLFSATYSGDSNFLPAKFPTYLETVNKATPAISLVGFSSSSVEFGETVTLNAEVVSNISIPTGTVSFYSGSTLLSTVSLNSVGSASVNLSSLPIGTSSLTAVYNGDPNFLTVTSSALSQTVVQAASMVSITSSTPNPSTFNTPATFNVTVSPVYPASGVPTGTITAFYGSTNLGTTTLNGGVGSFVTSILPVGVDTVTVVYNGSANFRGSTGLGTHQVNAATTTVSSFTSSQNPSVFGQSVTFSATITSTAGTPTGTVTFFDGTTQRGIATLNSSGTAAISTTVLTVGSHTMTAVYSGSDNYAGVTSANLTQVVNKAATSTVLNTNVTTAVYGQAVTFSAAVSPTSPGAGTPTGTITFKNGSTTLGTVMISNGGTASFTTSSLAASSTPYSITAVYSGDTNFATSTSTATSLTVNPVSTIISATSSTNPSVLGQSVTFNVTVNAVNTSTIFPGGTVTATYGSTVIGTGSLSSTGTISFTTSSLPAGILPIIFTYSGNSNFNSSSTTLDQTVQTASSTTTLTSSVNPSHFGQNVVFTATVSGSSGTPTGTVSFFRGTTLIGTQSLVSGVATLNISTLPLGTSVIQAVYNGDSNYSTSTSSSLSQVVQQGTTATVLTSSVNPSQFGQTVLLTATVSVTAGAGTATGTVSFFDGSTLIGTSGLSGNLATLSVSNLSVGTHTLLAVYSGDADFSTSTSANITQTVNIATTTVSLTSSLNPSTLGAAVTFNAVVFVPVGGGAPTGTVTFKDGSTNIGTVPLSGENASFTISTLSLGTHTITSTYNGDSNFAAATSQNLSQVVDQGTSQTVLTSNVNPSSYGQTVNLSATVTGSDSAIPATGTVTFFDGSTNLGSSTLSGGVATLAVSSFSVDSHTLTAVYSGDTNYTTSTSPEYIQSVTAVATTTTLSSSENPSSYGDAVTFTAVVAPQVGTAVPNGLVSFREGAVILGSVPLSGGQATFTISSLNAGEHSISAIYLGNTNFLTSTSNTLEQTVEQVSSVVVLFSSLNPSNYGDSVDLTADLITLLELGDAVPTGTVTFVDGATVLGSATLVSGVATLSISTLSVGSHSITANYSGDINYTSASSDPLVQVVNQASTATNILSTTPNPSMFGQTVTMFAAVSGTPGVPTGTVSFYDGSTLLGTVSVYDGIAIYNTNLLAIGNHSITAEYNGDSNFLTSVSSPVIQTVDQTTITQTTVTTLTSNLNPSTYGQAVEFDVTVIPIAGSGTPTGIVTLYSGSTLLGTISLVNGGGSFTTSDLPAGNLTIVALYSGDDAYSASTATLSQVVNPLATSSTISSSANPVTVFQPVTFTSQVTTTSGTIPVGTVSFYDGTTLIGTALVNSSGVAVITTSTLTTGSHTINTVYNPFANFATSSSSLTQQVNPAPTETTVLGSNPNPSQEGQSVTITAAVTSNDGIPPGLINFYDGSTLIGTSQLFNGIGVIRVTTLTPGNHTITVTYPATTNYSTSTSASYTQVVNPNRIATTTALTSSLNPSVYGNTVTFNATVMPQSGSGVPTGSVTFSDGSTVLGTVNLSSGSASFSTSTLNVGTHPITVTYSGDSTYSASTSSTLSQVVMQGTADLTLSTSVNPSTFGQSVTLSASLSIVSGSGTPTGSVTFYDGNTAIGTAAVFGGTASLAVSNFTVGTHPLTAVYSGDTNFATTTSNQVNQVVNQSTTATQILSNSPNPSMLGQNVSFFATVTSPLGTPTGTVSFYDGSTLLGTANLSDGLAIYQTSLLAVGNHNITATYNGNSNFSVSTSPPIVQTVNQINITVTTVTTLTSSVNPSNYGQPVTFDVTVAPLAGPGTPTGVVTLYSGAEPLVTLPLVNGMASYTISTLPAGLNTIVALYSGDSNFSSSTTTLAQTVIAIATTTTVTSTPNPSGVNSPVTFTAQVIAASGIPTGTVSFYDGIDLLGTSLLNGSGQATLTTTTLTIGSHTINAVYNATNNYNGSSGSMTQVVSLDMTITTILFSSPNPSTVGEPVIFIASVTATGVGVPTGTVTFYDGANVLGTGTLLNGLAVFTTSALTVGQHSITASYPGSALFNPSVSPPYTQLVVQSIFDTMTTLTSSNNPSEFGENVVFTATVTAGAGIPTGSVTFYDGTQAIGSSLLIDGVAQLATSTLSIGKHPITAIYSGDNLYNSSSSSLLVQVVKKSSAPPPPRDFYGQQIINKYLTFNERVNQLTWIPPQNDKHVVRYEIYRDSGLTHLIGSVGASGPYVFEDGNQKRRAVTYYIVSVGRNGVQSVPVSTTVEPKKGSK